MGKKSVVRATKISLNITLVVFVMMFMGGVLYNLNNPEILGMNKILYLSFISIVGALIIYLIFLLKHIIMTVENNNPFCKENTQRFKRIGYSIFFIGLLDTIKRFPSYTESGILATPYGGLGEFFFIYLVLGLLALLLSEIFDKALEIKNENDMTI